MPKFTFKIFHYNSKFKLDNDWSEWISAKDKIDAQSTIESAYPENLGYKCTLISIED